jgi:hypothetical protein
LPKSFGVDDDLGPIAAPVVGAPATVIPRGDAPGGRGTLLADRLFAVTLSIPDAPWQHGDEVIVSVGDRGATVAALARFREARPGQAVFTRQSPWRPFNRRAFERYGVSISAAVAVPSQRLPATVVDVSLGGCALELDAPPPAGAEHVELDWPASPGPITARLVRHRPVGPARYAWHLRFDPLTPGAAAFLSELVATLAATLESPAA